MSPSPQTNFCFAKGCKVRLYKDELSPGGHRQLADVVVCSRGNHEFCEEHADMFVEVERDLPLAIQEFHALALLYPEAMRREYIVAPDWQIQVAQAQDRVVRLRALEAMLKGSE